MAEPLTQRQAVIVSAYTGYLICRFSDMHEAIEKKLGRPVFTHELGDERVMNEVREAFKPDFLSLLPEETKDESR